MRLSGFDSPDKPIIIPVALEVTTLGTLLAVMRLATLEVRRLELLNGATFIIEDALMLTRLDAVRLPILEVVRLVVEVVRLAILDTARFTPLAL